MGSRQKRILTLALGAIVVIGATVVRVLLAYKTPVCPNTVAMHDDMLLMDHANAIRDGVWLGAYSDTTLVKNVGYPLCLALYRILGLRYQLGFALMLVVACAISARSLRPLVPSWGIRCAIYLMLLYLPVFFTGMFFQRVYRNGIAVVLALQTFSSLMGVYLRRDERLGILMAWSVTAGLSLGLFSIIQESASWALPFAVVCLLVTAVLVLFDGIRLWTARGAQTRSVGFAQVEDEAGNEGLAAWYGALVTAARLAIVLAPLVIYLCVGVGVGRINNRWYGVSLQNDKYQGEFARASADIMSIDVGFPDNRVWVSREALAKAVELSPTLAQMEDELWSSWEGWQNLSASYHVLLEDEGPQVLGDHSYWAMRGAYAAYGGYEDAEQTEGYWKAVADELEEAFATGGAKKKEGLFVSQTTQPIPWDKVATWVTSSFALLNDYACGGLVGDEVIRPLPNTAVTEGRLDDQLEVRDLLGPNTLFMVDGQIYEDRTSEVAQQWLVVNNVVGSALFAVQRVLVPLTVVGLVFLTVWDVRGRQRAGAQTALMLAGLYLSSYGLVFGASWMISFLSTQETALSAASPALSYCGALYALVGLAESIVLGRLAQRALDRLRGC